MGYNMNFHYMGRHNQQYLNERSHGSDNSRDGGNFDWPLLKQTRGFKQKMVAKSTESRNGK